MTAKKRTNPLQRTTTDATKAKLPKPRTRKVKLAEVGTQPAPDFRVVPVPSITNAEYRRDGKPGTGAQVPCMDWPADSLPSGTIPPNTEPYPWPVRLFNWLDNRYEDARWWLATRLQRLAKLVSPL